MTEAWCVRSVVTDGSGHSTVDTDCMPQSALAQTLADLCGLYNVTPQRFPGGVSRGRFGPFYRWTFEQRLSDGRRVTDMIIASKIH